MSTSSSRGRATRVAAALLALGLLGGLVLQACGSDSSSSSTDTTSADGSTTTTVVKTTSLDEVTVEGALDEAPTITFDPSYVGEADAFKVVAEGDGPVVTAEQRVSVDYVATSGADGSVLGSTYDTEPDKLFLDDSTLRPIIAEALVGQKVGTRVLIAIDATDPTTGTGEWNVVAFEIQEAVTIPTTAEGEAVAPVAGLPVVTVENDVPSITKPDGAAPTELVVQPLIKGTGPVVTAGQTLTVHYTGMIWGSGTVFDSSWERGSPVEFAVGDGQLIAGFDEGLVGQTVGSRVLIVIPPDKGYGAEGNSQAGIAGTDTLIFVVDILAAE